MSAPTHRGAASAEGALCSSTWRRVCTPKRWPTINDTAVSRPIISYTTPPCSLPFRVDINWERKTAGTARGARRTRASVASQVRWKICVSGQCLVENGFPASTVHGWRFKNGTSPRPLQRYAQDHRHNREQQRRCSIVRFSASHSGLSSPLATKEESSSSAPQRQGPVCNCSSSGPA